jgi:hypothetical protein
MHIEYQISEGDFVSAARLAMRTRSKWSMYSMYALRGFGALLIASSVVPMIKANSVTPGLATLFWGSFLVCMPLVWNYQFRKQYRKNSLLHDRRSLEVDDTQLHFKTSTSEGSSTWSSYTKFAENDLTFIVFQQGNQIFVPLPKRELSETQIAEHRSLFAAHLASK